MEKQYNGRLADPEFRRQRAQKAALARTSLDAHIDAVVAAAPQLTDAQVAKLRPLVPAGV